jgi:hypothetical protein
MQLCGSSKRRQALRVERFMGAEIAGMPGGAPLLREENNKTHPPKHYGIIRRLATDLRYQDDMQAAVMDVFARMESLSESLPIPGLDGQ